MINAVGQLFLLDALLVNDYHLYGAYIIERNNYYNNSNYYYCYYHYYNDYGAYIVERLLRGQDWTQSERFPRVTLCEFEIRRQSRLHNYVVQCTLTINLFNEKIFLFVWLCTIRHLACSSSGQDWTDHWSAWSVYAGLRCRSSCSSGSGSWRWLSSASSTSFSGCFAPSTGPVRCSTFASNCALSTRHSVSRASWPSLPRTIYAAMECSLFD